jgi:hypothetical protein
MCGYFFLIRASTINNNSNSPVVSLCDITPYTVIYGDFNAKAFTNNKYFLIY